MIGVKIYELYEDKGDKFRWNWQRTGLIKIKVKLVEFEMYSTGRQERNSEYSESRLLSLETACNWIIPVSHLHFKWRQLAIVQ